MSLGFPLAVFASRWVSDQDFSMTYSYLKAGGTPADRDQIAEPYMGLQIAGEATWSEAPGTMHGAWFSGVRAADRVVDKKDCAAKSSTLPSSESSLCDVLVVGAGLAGIAAARTLVAAGRKVVVLEAGVSPLGRARGLSTPWGDVPLGGMWLHGAETHPLLPFVRSAGIALVPDVWSVKDDDPLGITSPVFTKDGLLDHAEHNREVRTFREAQRRLDIVQGDDRDLSGNLLPLLTPLRQGSRYLQETWHKVLYEGLVAGDLGDLSTRHRLEPFVLAGADMMLTASLSKCESVLVEGLNIRYSTRATNVVYDQGHWHVSSDNGPRFSAPSVIVTVALPPLERISIRPSLPKATRRALARIGRGQGGKFFAVFEEAFWSPLSSFFLAVPGNPLGRVFVDASAVLGRPTLAGFTTFHETSRLESLSAFDLCKEVSELLAPVALWSRGAARR